MKLNLDIAYWNIRGLYRREGSRKILKLSEDELIDCVSGNDIICLTEIHIGDNIDKESLKIKNYDEFVNVRKRGKNAKRDSGGLLLYIKSCLKPGITVIPYTSSEFIWIKLKKDFFQLSEDIFICFVYDNPKNSTYSTKQDTLQEVKEGVAKYRNQGKTLIIGDLNGHTNIKPDYNPMDDFNKYIPLPENYTIDLPLSRNNQDSRPPDTRGKDILELCKSSGLRIVNGRKIGDLLGRGTFLDTRSKIPSTIDYVLAEKELFKDILYFRVNDFSLLSDHAMISLKLKASFEHTIAATLSENDDTGSMRCAPARFIWDKAQKIKFQNTIASPKYKMKINELANCKYDENEAGINAAIDDINNIFVNL